MNLSLPFSTTSVTSAKRICIASASFPSIWSIVAGVSTRHPFCSDFCFVSIPTYQIWDTCPSRTTTSRGSLNILACMFCFVNAVIQEKNQTRSLFVLLLYEAGRIPRNKDLENLHESLD